MSVRKSAKKKEREVFRFRSTLSLFLVVPPGIEPGTQGFSVLCSTNWAKVPNHSQIWEVQKYIFFLTSQIFVKKS